MRHTKIDGPYDLVEIFCGKHAVSRAFEEVGMKTFKYDIRLNSGHNVHTRSGILTVCEALCHTHAWKSLAMFEPVCGSWIFISLGTTLRHIVP